MGCQSSKDSKAGRPSLAAKSLEQPGTLLASRTEQKSIEALNPAVKVEQGPGVGVAQPTSEALAASVGTGSMASPVEGAHSRTNAGQRSHGISEGVVATAQCSNMTSQGSGLPAERASSRHGTLHKSRTLCSEKHELDVMIVEFIAHDSTVGSFLGRNSKEMQWKVMFDREAAPIDVKLHVQEHKLHSNEVRIESDGQSIFHGAGSHAKAKMLEDFTYEWPFRATIRGINEPNFFEVHLPHSSNDAWFPATVVGQRPDGNFEVVAMEPDATGRWVERKYPAVERANLREAASGRPISVPENHLLLEVPKDKPLNAVLSLADGERVTHHFGRPSPPPGANKAELSLKVSKDRSKVTAEAGHSVLSHFVSGEVQAIASHVERLRHSWTLQLGPFAEHTIEITKKYTLGKIVSLLVDGEILVEASPADIGCEGHDWHCDFRLVGERALNFEVFKTNVDGAALDETDHVVERRKYAHQCSVVIPNSLDFSSAQLWVDGSDFSHLPVQPPVHEDVNISMDPTAMTHSYGITVPYKVDHDAPSNIVAFASHVFAKAPVSRKSAGGFFARCYDCSCVMEDSTEQK